MYLSPHVKKPFNSKVIKCFVPELRSRQVFFVFWDSHVLCIYVMNILCTFHIFIYGYVTNRLRRENEFISDVLLWTLPYGHTGIGLLAETYIHNLRTDTGYCLEDQLAAMNDWDRWKKENQ